MDGRDQSAWGKRIGSIDVLAADWKKFEPFDRVNNVLGVNNFNRMTTEEIIAHFSSGALCRRAGFAGPDRDLALMSQLWNQSIVTGREADRFQRDLVQWLSSSPVRDQP